MIVAPEGLSRFYRDPTPAAGEALPRVGASWMTREDREHEIADQVTYLDTLHAYLRAQSASDVRLRVLGFSQGVATAGRWLVRGRARPSELILWAGAFPPEVDAATLRDRFAAATSVVLVTGTRDRLTSWMAAEAQLERFRAAGVRARLVPFDGGHRLDDETLRALADAPPNGA
jgi:predicted esterase